MTGKGSGRRKENTGLVRKNWDNIKWGVKDGVTLADAAKKCTKVFRGFDDALAGDGDTFEEKVSLSDEMQLHGEKHKPEGL